MREQTDLQLLDSEVRKGPQSRMLQPVEAGEGEMDPSPNQGIWKELSPAWWAPSQSFDL